MIKKELFPYVYYAFLVLSLLCIFNRNVIQKLFFIFFQGTSQDVDSVLYKWNYKTDYFDEYQSILTTGAYDWTSFTVEGYHFLALAQAFNGITTLFESRIYIFQDNEFRLFQTMEVSCDRLKH